MTTRPPGQADSIALHRFAPVGGGGVGKKDTKKAKHANFARNKNIELLFRNNNNKKLFVFPCIYILGVL